MEIQTMAVNNLDHNTTHDLTSPLLCNFQALDFKLCSSTHHNPNSSPPSPQPMGLSLQKFGITNIEPNLDVDGVDEEEFSTSLLDREDGVDVEPTFGGSEYRVDSAIVELKIASRDREDGVDIERFAGSENRVESAIVEQKVASLDRQDGMNIERFAGSEYRVDSAIVANKDIEGTAVEEHDLKIASLDRQDGVDIEPFRSSEYRADSAIFEQKIASVDPQDGVDVERFGGSENRVDSAIVELKIASLDRQDGVDIERVAGSENRVESAIVGLENKVDSAIVELKKASLDRQDDIERFAGSEYRADSAIVAKEDVEGAADEEHELKITLPDRQVGIDAIVEMKIDLVDRQVGVDMERFVGSENKVDSAIFEQKIASVERFAGSENRANSAIVELKNSSLDRQDGVDIEHFAGSEYRADSAIVEDAGVEEQELKIASLDGQDGVDMEPFRSSGYRADSAIVEPSEYKAISAIVEKEVVEGDAEEEHDLKTTSPDRQDGIDTEPFTNSKYKANSSIVANKEVERAADQEHELNTDFQDRLNTLFATVANKVVEKGAEELNSTSPDQQNGINIEPFTGSEYKAAIKLQKFYKSYRTRRRLADSAIVAEELWWQARDFARLNHTTVSFFNYSKPETAISRWNRVSINASKVGQGLSKDGKALKLAFQHWIEAIDPRHRYGHNLHFYYEKWCESKTDQPFFYWLDLGEGKNLDLEECPRSLLRQQCIKYLGPHERERYEYVLVESRIRHKQTGDLLDTTKGPEGAKWIFVMSTSRRLYAGRKERGRFQHSSFLAGGTTIAAGRLTAENGVLKAIWAYSGHYKPTTDNLKQFIDYLRENGADLNLVQIRASGKEDYNEDDVENPQSQTGKSLDSSASVLKPPPLRIPAVNFAPLDKPIESSIDNKSEVKGGVYRRTFSGGLQSPVAGVPEKAISERIKSKRESGSYQLGHQVSSKWCSGVGPRIGCIADYPVELRLHALEFTNLSPRTTQTPTQSLCSSSVLSPLSQVIS